ncbi:hypothetical protein [Streptomyces sp. NPDC005989]|uniref:hypothetical protein n=1 Tax=Streptomyces sp. NPDC005989 TaxID=3156727 RepID=UPI0033F10425
MPVEHELRAEYLDGHTATDPTAEVEVWHVIRQEASTALCGRDLQPAAEVRSADDWGTPGMPICRTCGTLYLHEQP